MSPTKKSQTAPVVYCAGPMFSLGDHTEQLRLGRVLERAGFETYIPQRDGIETAKVMWAINHPRFPDPSVNLQVTQFVRKLVFSLDVFQIVERCTAIVMNADGRVPDEGTVAEAGMGWALGKAVVLFKSTPVSMFAGWDNPMLSGLAAGWTAVTTTKALPAAVTDAIAANAARTGPAAVPPPLVAATVALGRRVWELMPEVTATAGQKDPKKLYDSVTKLAAKLGPLMGSVG